MPTIRRSDVTVAKKFNVTVEQVAKLREAMSSVWSGIASDWLAGFGSESEAYEAFDNDEGAMVAEATIDAGRLVTFGEMTEEEMEVLHTTTKYRLMELAVAVWNSQ